MSFRATACRFLRRHSREWAQSSKFLTTFQEAIKNQRIGLMFGYIPMRYLHAPHRWGLFLARLTGFLLIPLAVPPAGGQTPKDNGIHVGEPKIYDSRALTLMLDGLRKSLANPSFIDPKSLASALGNLQGFSSQDFSQGLQATGNLSPQAAPVSSGATSSTASSTLAGSSGPQPPILPALQTPPSFAPTFGLSAGDLLSEEVNLTYQFDNISMLLQRSLTDRLFKGKARLQAVIGFDIDIEPTAEARDAAAIVDVSVKLASCGGLSSCDDNEGLSVVAIMPEEGSHNAATLSQKANAFGGAIAYSVFSVGYAAQKRSQVFYLYRDMDTVSFQKSDPNSKSVDFGWQFRPVWGRRSVSPGMRHMIAVLALPENDSHGDVGSPELEVTVKTSWTRYERATQTVGAKLGFWSKLFGGNNLPKPGPPEVFKGVAVPTTAAFQEDLGPKISNVKWVQGDGSTGVAIVTGENFFPGTTLRFGAKTYSTPADGLIIKSDQELEVALPLTAAVTEGVLSGRYGEALPLQASDSTLPAGFKIEKPKLSATGSDMYQLDATLVFYDKAHQPQTVSISDLQKKANSPIVSVNGTPLSTPSFLDNDHGSIKVTTFFPSSLLKSGSAEVTVTFPFAGPDWSSSLPIYQATLKIVRLGGKDNTRLLISATDATMLLCGSHPNHPDASHPAQTWVVQLGPSRSFDVLPDNVPVPSGGGVKCMDHGPPEMLSLDMPTADLKQYHRFALLNTVNTVGKFPPIVGDIPPQEPPPPGPSLDKDQKISVAQYDVKSVTYKGKNLDQVKKVLFGKVELSFTVGKDGKTIVIELSPVVTEKPRNVELQLISDDNEPVLAPLSVTAATAQKVGK